MAKRTTPGAARAARLRSRKGGSRLDGIFRPRSIAVIGASRHKQTIGHEMTHVISQHAIRPHEKRGFINEGIAIVHDQTGRDTMHRARQAVDMGRRGIGNDPYVQVVIRALWEDWQLLTNTYSYPIAAAFTHVLLEKGGKDRYLEFFVDQSYAHARQVYGADLETWIDAFEAELYAE